MSGRTPPDPAGMRNGKTMSDEQRPLTARELLAKAWELTRESMALIGLPIPLAIRFQIDGLEHVRATRASPSSTNWQRRSAPLRKTSSGWSRAHRH
jgi:hypothetical protein